MTSTNWIPRSSLLVCSAILIAMTTLSNRVSYGQTDQGSGLVSCPANTNASNHIGSFFAYMGSNDPDLLADSLASFLAGSGNTDSLFPWETYHYAEERMLHSLYTGSGLSDSSYGAVGNRAILLQLYGRLLRALRDRGRSQTSDSSLPQNLKCFARDAVLLTAVYDKAMPSATMLKCLTRRTDSTEADGSFIASVRDALDLEYPNAKGAANLIAAVWVREGLFSLPDGSMELDVYRSSCKKYAMNALATLHNEYSRSIACYILAEQLSIADMDLAWDYFFESLSLISDTCHHSCEFFGKYYSRDDYVSSAAIHLRTNYLRHLHDSRRFMEISLVTNRLINCRAIDAMTCRQVTKQALHWIEEAIRITINEGKYRLSSQLDAERQNLKDRFDMCSKIVREMH